MAPSIDVSPSAARPIGASAYPWLIELLPVFLGGEAIHWLQPLDPASWRIICPAERQPREVVLAALAHLGCGPYIVHSTSWRYERGLVLTYLVVIPERHGPADGFQIIPVTHRPLARGTLTDPPNVIEVQQVLEHALRHLAWLALDDPAVTFALGDGWRRALADYLPSPFLALDDYR